MIIEDIFEYDQVFVQVIADELAGGYGVSMWTPPDKGNKEIPFRDLPKDVRSRLRSRGLPAVKKQPRFKRKNDAVTFARNLARVMVEQGFAPDVMVMSDDREEVTYLIAPPFNVQTEK